MGRNVKEVAVPVNGASFRNSSSNGMIVDSDGAMHIASTSSACLSAVDFPKYVGLNTQSSTIAGTSVSPNASKSLGQLKQSDTSVNLSQYIPYLDYPQNSGYGYLKNSRRATRYHGMVANVGNYYVMQQCKMGYYTGSSSNPMVVYDKANRKITRELGSHSMGCWYDSTSGTLKALCGGQYETPRLYQSVDGITWTSALVTYTSSGSNVFTLQWVGDSSYGLHCSMIVNGQNIYVVLQSSVTSNNYALWVSTDGGASFTDRTFNMMPSSAWNFYTAKFFTHDGTTLLIDDQTDGKYRYSTNNGANWANSTITGVTTTPSFAVREVIKGTNPSHLMMISTTISTSNYVWYSSDGGQNFITYAWTPADTLETSYTQTFGDQYNGVWAFAYIGNQGTWVASSSNNGVSWTHTYINNKKHYTSYIVDGGDALYLFAFHEIYKSTNGTTWTLLATNPKGPAYNFASGNYTQPYMFTSEYIATGSGNVVNKTTGSVTQGTNTTFYSSYSPYRTFNNLAGTDHWLNIQTSHANFVNSVSNSEGASLTLFAPYGYTSQQAGAGTQPVNIEYWRIK